jgi:hypothetical protein
MELTKDQYKRNFVYITAFSSIFFLVSSLFSSINMTAIAA